MGYSDLKEEDVIKLIDAIKSARLYTDLLLIEEEMMRKGKVNNDAWRFLQQEKQRKRIEANEKSRGRK